MRRETLIALAALVLAGPVAASKGTLQQRLAAAKNLLVQASASSKTAPVKQGIARAQTMLNSKQYEAARKQVSELKRTAALNRENTAAVLKLIDAEDAIGDVINKVKNPGKEK